MPPKTSPKNNNGNFSNVPAHRSLVSQKKAYAFLRREAPKLPVYLVGAHGATIGFDSKPHMYFFQVPKNVCLVFFCLPGYPAYISDREKPMMAQAARAILNRQNLSMDQVGQYVSVYVPGDKVPEMRLEFSDVDPNRNYDKHLFGIVNVAKGTEFAYRKGRDMFLSELLMRGGEGVYMIKACRLMEPGGYTNNLRKAQMADVLTRTRLLPTTTRPEHRFAHLLAPDIQLRSGEEHEDFAKVVYRPYLLHVLGIMLRTRRGADRRNDAPPPAVDKRLLRKYGFDTRDKERLHRLYAYHKSKARGNKKHAEIDRAFSFRLASSTRFHTPRSRLTG